MRTFTYEFRGEILFSDPISQQYTTLRILPYEDGTQLMTGGSIAVTPHHLVSYAKDGFGNRLMSAGFPQEHEKFGYCERAEVVIDHSKREEEVPHPMYRHPGLLTRPDEALYEFAMSLGSNDPEVLARAVTEHFVYTPGATGVATTAAESFAGGVGVCQDYAQVLATVCRIRGLHARYCMGITEGTGVTHAWTQIHTKGKWFGIDPTRECLADESYLLFAVGRDAMDCPVERGSFIGHALQTQTVSAVMTDIGG